MSRPRYLPGAVLRATDLEDERAWRASLEERHADRSHPTGAAVGAVLGDVGGRVRLVFERLIDGARRVGLHVGDARRLQLEPGSARHSGDHETGTEIPNDGGPGRLEITGGLRAPKLENALRVDLAATQPATVPLRTFAFVHRAADPERGLQEALVLTLAAPVSKAPAPGFAVGRWKKDQGFTAQLAVRPGRGLIIRGELRQPRGRRIERPPLPPGAETAPSDEEIQKAWLRTPEGAAARQEIIISFAGKFVLEIKGARIAGGKAEYRVALHNSGPGPIGELRLHQAWLPAADSGVTPSWQPLPLPTGQSIAPGESFAPTTRFELGAPDSQRRLGVHAAGLVTYDVPIVAFAEVSL
jgi:hypothetical protein